ncbi:hypothetical protein GN958_ATG18534 [Phytophthora infestans]|uniref:Uncharacterized protein n=1 Tax=Phytophthora infestans TaxID=4787 RepID=A0A8S9TXM2_PHYIN|nr:hypothetical protein GN958_ATG18534 [Phytophthora infestans]
MATREEDTGSGPPQWENIQQRSSGDTPRDLHAAFGRFRSPPSSALRRTLRYSPYQRGSSPLSPPEDLTSPATGSRRVMFSPPPHSPPPSRTLPTPAPARSPPPYANRGGSTSLSNAIASSTCFYSYTIAQASSRFVPVAQGFS